MLPDMQPLGARRGGCTKKAVFTAPFDLSLTRLLLQLCLRLGVTPSVGGECMANRRLITYQNGGSMVG